MQQSISDCQNSYEKLQQILKEAKQRRCAPDRASKLQKLNDLIEQEKLLNQQLEVLKSNDPEEVARVEKTADYCKSAADRWTDNIFTLKSYLVKKQGISGKEVKNSDKFYL